MLEVGAQKKNKILLSDYDFDHDVKCRLMLAEFTPFDVEVLEEILYSSLTISKQQLLTRLSCDVASLEKTLEKLVEMRLLSDGGMEIEVDKEQRKHFENELAKFEEDFAPGMECLQGILKKVPIHSLPVWYAIPRMSNNIFESIVEKYLTTPTVFNRYLLDLMLPEPLMHQIMDELYASDGMMLTAESIKEKYQLEDQQFEEIALNLEFHLVAVLSYRQVGDRYEEVLTPFAEWREYNLAVEGTELPSIEHVFDIERRRPHDFSFVQDMSAILHYIRKNRGIDPTVEEERAAALANCDGLENMEGSYFDKIIALLMHLNLLVRSEGNQLISSESAGEWLEMRVENRALYLHRFPMGAFTRECTEKNIRAVEHALIPLVGRGWVFFDDFLKGSMISLTDEQMVQLKKVGRKWEYTLPSYSEEEKELIHAIIFDWLFAIGFVATGKYEGKECFTITPFGETYFEK